MSKKNYELMQIKCHVCGKTHPCKVPMRNKHLRYNPTTVIFVCPKTGAKLEASFAEPSTPAPAGKGRTQ